MHVLLAMSCINVSSDTPMNDSQSHIRLPQKFDLGTRFHLKDRVHRAQDLESCSREGR